MALDCWWQQIASLRLAQNGIFWVNLLPPRPAVSVIMGAYNAERYLSIAIESILCQDFDDFEFLILDDGSTDGTLKIAEGFAARDPRVRILSETHRGHTAALNQLLREAKAPLIARADADDVFHATRFSRQVAFLETHADHGVVGCDVKYIDANGDPIPWRAGYAHDHASILRALLEHSPSIAHPTVMMRRELVLAVGCYREAFDPAEDYDLWLRLSGVTKLANLSDPLVDYRCHSEQLSEKYKPRQIRSVAIARLAHNARLAGRPDPTQGLTTLPATEELDALFGPGSAAYINRRIYEKIRNSLDRVTGEGWEAALGHARASPSWKSFRTASRLLLAGKVAAATRLYFALLRGFGLAAWQRLARTPS